MTKYLCISSVPFDGLYLYVAEADSRESAKAMAAQRFSDPRDKSRVDFVDEVIPLESLEDGWSNYLDR